MAKIMQLWLSECSRRGAIASARLVHACRERRPRRSRRPPLSCAVASCLCPGLLPSLLRLLQPLHIKLEVLPPLSDAQRFPPA